MSRLCYFAADCPLEEEAVGEMQFPPAVRITTDPPKAEILGNRAWYRISADDSLWQESEIHTALDHMAEFRWDTLTEELGRKLIGYIRRHLEHTEEFEIWNLWLGEDFYRHKFYTITIDELTPRDLEILFGMEDISGVWGAEDEYGYIPESARPVQHCLIVTKEPALWDDRMKNWRELYPLTGSDRI